MLKVFAEDKKNPDVFLKLVTIGGKIVLLAVDEKGNPINAGSILEISQNGIKLHNHLSDKLGITTKDNKVAIY